MIRPGSSAREAWADAAAYAAARKLAGLFRANFTAYEYESGANAGLNAGGPRA